MAKSNRRRKHDRAVRQAKAARKQTAAQQRQAADLLVEEAERLAYRIRDPATPAEEVAQLLAAQPGDDPGIPGMPDALVQLGSSPERLVRISELWQAAEAAEAADGAEASEATSPSVRSLAFAAGAARVAGDTARARTLLDDALAQAGDPENRVRMSGHLRVHGRVAEAAELLEGMLGQNPADEFAAEYYALTMEEAFARQSGGDPPGPCACGSGEPWPDCCGPRERAALDRFADRSGLTAFQDAVAAYIPRSAYRKRIPEFVAEWRSVTESGDWHDAERASLTGMAGELSLILATLPDNAPGAGDANPEGDANGEGGVLTAFASEPGTSEELAGRARAWTDDIHYGLWQIAEPDPAPGVWCTDVVTGVTRYVAFPAEMIRQFPRWGVLFGAVVPVDGVWRYTGQAFQVNPDEADALSETLTDATEMLVADLIGKPSKRAARRAHRPVPFGRAKPNGVTAYQVSGASAETTQVFSMVAANLLLRLADEVHEHRADPTGRAAPPEPGWEKQWLDEPVPALGGRTPLQATRSPERIYLEALLRQFEYEADLLAAEGKTGIDTGWLRDELVMTGDRYGLAL